MATLVLTTVGTILGGPIGGAIGALAGQAVDAQIFKPTGREGPRLADLRLQTSTYGTQVPHLFGRMRVAGTVIWATDLHENSQTSGGGKGQPNITTYNYSASFAVALSARTIRRVGRIWADGNLLRGAADDFKTGIGAFRAHFGDADQAADPLIVADRGEALTPACRGMTYAVFEGLQLADYGNRIPSLTFELVADEEPVVVDAICASLLREPVVTLGGSAPQVIGYAAAGQSVGEAVTPLLECHALLLRNSDGVQAITAGVEDTDLLSRADDLAMSNGRALASREEERQSVESVARRVSLRYYDPSRDYQTGAQSAERQGAGSSETQIDLPAVIEAATARQSAAQTLRQRFVGRRTMTVSRGWASLLSAPGDLVALEGAGGRWRIETLEWENLAVRFGLRAVPSQTTPLVPGADAGASIGAADLSAGPTHLTLVETPQLTDSAVDVPQVFAVACGDSRAWRSAALFAKDAAGAYDPIGVIRRPAVLGVVDNLVPAGSASLIDRFSSIEVTLFDSDAALAAVSDAALLDGANGCMVGDELIQFGSVSQSGPRQYRLSRLLRGRRGTETWMGTHRVGERFLLLQPDRLQALPSDRAVMGRALEIAAQGIGDESLPTAIYTVRGIAMAPLSPVHLRLSGDSASGIDAGWTRRSRMGWHWIDDSDAPLGEEAEAYRVEVLAGDVLLRSETVMVPAWAYTPAAIATDLLAAGTSPLRLEVRQRGNYGLGAAATAMLDV